MAPVVNVAPGAVRVAPDVAAAAVLAARMIVDVARECVERDGRFLWALAGGSTPRAVYELLAAPPLIDAIPWPKVDIFFGDERCVPIDHVDRNERMARAAMLDRVPIVEVRVHSVSGADRDPEEAARDYERVLRESWGADGIPRFDLVLLGVGEDGHTASLFPGTRALAETERWVAVGDKNGEPRITFTLPLLDAARRVWFLATGSAKAGIVSRILTDPDARVRWPSAKISSESKELLWILDAASALGLKPPIPA